MSTINFGAINGRRMVSFKVSFKVSNDGRVLPRSFPPTVQAELDDFIPARESFRRWKIARKAWKTRKARQQPEFPLTSL